MIYKNIKDMKVSSIVLGTDGYGHAIDDKTAFDMLDRYIFLGGNTIDTARIYSSHSGGKCGDSERTIGSWLKQRNCRNEVILSTKCAHPFLSSMEINRLSKADIESDVEESLRALGTDYIDILWLHRDDESVSAGAVVEATADLIKKGKVRMVAASNWRGKRIKEANEYALSNGISPFEASQIKWSAARSAPEYEDDPTLVEMNGAEYEFYKSTKMPVFAYASQAKGFFQKYDKGGENALSDKARTRYMCRENVKRYEKLKQICEKYSIGLSAAVLCSIVSNTDFDTFAIAGCKSAEQVEDSMSQADCVIDYEDARKILCV